METTSRGSPIVISAASGTGKTTLTLRLLEKVSHVARSISYTTRDARSGEVDGRDYHFISETRFDGMVERGEFIEWAQVHRRRYGTGIASVQSQLGEGYDVLLDIDVQGGAQIKGRLANALTIFLLPPSMDELRRRLERRATERSDAIELRLANARREIAMGRGYDLLIINDDFDRAASELEAAVRAHRLRTNRPDGLVDALLDGTLAI